MGKVSYYMHLQLYFIYIWATSALRSRQNVTLPRFTFLPSQANFTADNRLNLKTSTCSGSSPNHHLKCCTNLDLELLSEHLVWGKMEPMSLGSPTSSPSSPPSWGAGPPLHSLSLTSPTAPYHQHGAYNSPHQQSYHSGFNTPQQQQHVQHQQLVQHPHQQQQQQAATQSGFLPGFLMGEPVRQS